LGYIEETLGHSETLVYKARFHWLHYALALIELALILGLVVWIVFFAPSGWLHYLLLLACAAALLLLFRSVLPFLITEIGVTTQRLIVKRGWLARSTDEIALRSIEQVNLQQGLIGRLLGFGQVDVHGTGVDNLIIPPIADPLRFVKAIEDAKGSSPKVV
jgi:membrane protein YdbS with pleckstrin-like domain